MASISGRRAGLLNAHLAAVLFGLSGIFGALIRFDAFAITLGRAGFASLALLCIAVIQRRRLWPAGNRRQIWVLLGSGVLLGWHWVTFFKALKVGGVGIATVGFASFPAFITLLDVLIWGANIGRREWALLALVSLGLVLVTPSFSLGNQATAGLAWGIASGGLFAALALCNRHGARGMNAIQVACWQNLMVCVSIFPLYGLLGNESVGAVSADLASWFWLALLGILCTGLAHMLFVRCMNSLDARLAGTIVALEPVYAIACAWWLFHEQPSTRMLAGAALIILATVLASRRSGGAA